VRREFETGAHVVRSLDTTEALERRGRPESDPSDEGKAADVTVRKYGVEPKAAAAASGRQTPAEGSNVPAGVCRVRQAAVHPAMLERRPPRPRT
jgi:hypothetical protein